MPSSPNDYGPLNLGMGRPFATNEERLLDEALASQTQPGYVLAQRATSLRQIIPFRPRMGYPSKDERQATIAEVLNTGRYMPDRRTDFSGGVGSYTGSSVPSLANPY